MIHLFDTHCHLQDSRLRDSVDGCIERALAAGVENMVCCGCNEADWQGVIALAGRYPCIIPAFGLHPWFCSGRSSRWLDTLSGLLNDYPHAALGEIGLDHGLAIRNDAEQVSVFREQMHLARHLLRPVSVHCRKAWGTLMDLVRNEKLLTGHSGVVLHAYSGSAELVPELESHGVSFSFSGSITYEKNRRARSAVQVVDTGSLLVETDSPDSALYNQQGLNEPSTLSTVIEHMARLRGVTVASIAAFTTANAAAIFVRDSRADQLKMQ